MLSDTQLLTQLKTGDDASFNELFLRHYDRVYGVLYRLLGNKADAEDMAQQVFLKLYRVAPKTLNGREVDHNLAGWLYRVAVNMGYNALRSQRRRQAWAEKLARLSPGEIFALDPSHLAESQEAQARVRQVLAVMKPRQAKLLLLRHSGFSYKELATTLEVASGSIGSLLTRAERAFAKKYQMMFPEENDVN